MYIIVFLQLTCLEDEKESKGKKKKAGEERESRTVVSGEDYYLMKNLRMTTVA